MAPSDTPHVPAAMTMTDQLSRAIIARLQAEFPDLQHWKTDGARTAWRRRFRGDLKSDEHWRDAVMVSMSGLPADMLIVWTPEPTAISRTVGKKQIYDENAVRYIDGQFLQSAAVSGLNRGKVRRVRSRRHRELLIREFDLAGLTGLGKTLPVESLQRLPFKKVLVDRVDCSLGNMHRVGRGDWMKRYNGGGGTVNVAAVVYENETVAPTTQTKRLCIYVVKSRKAFGLTRPPDDFVREVSRFRHGQKIARKKDARPLGIIRRVGSNGSLSYDSGDGLKTVLARLVMAAE